jgi:hypothetical protein
MDQNFKAKPKVLAQLLVRIKAKNSKDEKRYRQKLNRALRTGLIVHDIDSKTYTRRSRRRHFDISASDVVTFAFVLLCLAAAIGWVPVIISGIGEGVIIVLPIFVISCMLL